MRKTNHIKKYWLTVGLAAIVVPLIPLIPWGHLWPAREAAPLSPDDWDKPQWFEARMSIDKFFDGSDDSKSLNGRYSGYTKQPHNYSSFAALLKTLDENNSAQKTNVLMYGAQRTHLLFNARGYAWANGKE